MKSSIGNDGIQLIYTGQCVLEEAIIFIGIILLTILLQRPPMYKKSKAV